MGIRERAIAATFRLEARDDDLNVTREDIRDVLMIIDAFGAALNLYVKEMKALALARVDAVNESKEA